MAAFQVRSPGTFGSPARGCASVALTKKSTNYVWIGAALVAGLAVVAYFGRSSSSSATGSGVSETSLRDVLQASTANTQSEDAVTIARIQSAANALTTLKYLEEQVQLGNI